VHRYWRTRLGAAGERPAGRRVPARHVTVTDGTLLVSDYASGQVQAIATAGLPAAG